MLYLFPVEHGSEAQKLIILSILYLFLGVVVEQTSTVCSLIGLGGKQGIPIYLSP